MRCWGRSPRLLAVAVGQARAKKILIPLNRCDSIVAGVEERSVSALLESALGELEKALDGRD